MFFSLLFLINSTEKKFRKEFSISNNSLQSLLSIELKKDDLYY